MEDQCIRKELKPKHKRSSSTGQPRRSAMSLIVIASILALSSPLLQSNAHPTAGEGLDALREVRYRGLQPKFSVLESRGEGSTASRTLWAGYEVRDSSGGSSWVVTRQIHNGSTAADDVVRSGTCPQVYGLILEMERLPIPRPEVRGTRSASPRGYVQPPPNLGPTHSSYAMWSQGWTSDGAPIELTASHLGAGPLEGWVASAEHHLKDCWTPVEED